jgi:hypothetical protein
VGPPGSGKTAFATWLISSSAAGEVLVARFRSLRDPSSGDALTFIESLARALSASYSGFTEALSSIVGNVSIKSPTTVQSVSSGGCVVGINIEQLQLAAMSPRDAFDRVIRAPLKSLPPPKAPFLVVVDGLDETLVDSEDNGLRDLLATEWGSDIVFLPQIRLLVTTRASAVTSVFVSSGLVANIDDSSPSWPERPPGHGLRRVPRSVSVPTWLIISGANEFGEPNGEPMPADAGPHQATASHGFRS